MGNNKERRHIWRRPMLLGASDTNLLQMAEVRNERKCDTSRRFILSTYTETTFDLGMYIQLNSGPHSDISAFFPGDVPLDEDLIWRLEINLPIADTAVQNYFTTQELMEAIEAADVLVWSSGQGAVPGTYTDPTNSIPLHLMPNPPAPPILVWERVGYFYFKNTSIPSDTELRRCYIYAINRDIVGGAPPSYELSTEIGMDVGRQEYSLIDLFSHRRTWITNVKETSNLEDVPGSDHREQTPLGGRLLMKAEDIAHTHINRADEAVSVGVDELNRRTLRRMPVPAKKEVDTSGAVPANRNRLLLSDFTFDESPLFESDNIVYVDRPDSALDEIFRVTDELGNDVFVEGERVRVVAVVSSDNSTLLDDPGDDLQTDLALISPAYQNTGAVGIIGSLQFGKVNQIKYEKIGPSTPDYGSDSVSAGRNAPGYPPFILSVEKKTAVRISAQIKDKDALPFSSPFQMDVKEFDHARIQNSVLADPINHNSEGLDYVPDPYGETFESIREAFEEGLLRLDYEVEGLLDDHTVVLRSRQVSVEGQFPLGMLNDGFGETVAGYGDFGELIITAPGDYFKEPWVFLWPIPRQYKRIFVHFYAAQPDWHPKKITEPEDYRPYYTGYDDVPPIVGQQALPGIAQEHIGRIMGRHYEQTELYHVRPFAYPEAVLDPSNYRMPALWRERDGSYPRSSGTVVEATPYRYEGDPLLTLEDLHRRVSVQGILGGMSRVIDPQLYEYGEVPPSAMADLWTTESGGHFGHVSGYPMTLHNTDQFGGAVPYSSSFKTVPAIARSEGSGPFDVSINSIGVVSYVGISGSGPQFTPDDVGLVIAFSGPANPIRYYPFLIIGYIDNEHVIVESSSIPINGEILPHLTGDATIYESAQYQSANDGAMVRLSREGFEEVDVVAKHGLMLDMVTTDEQMGVPLLIRRPIYFNDLSVVPVDMSIRGTENYQLQTRTAGQFVFDNLRQLGVRDGSEGIVADNATIIEVRGSSYWDGFYNIESFFFDVGTDFGIEIRSISKRPQNVQAKERVLVTFYRINASAGMEKPWVAGAIDPPPAGIPPASNDYPRAALSGAAFQFPDTPQADKVAYGVYGSAWGMDGDFAAHGVVGRANAWEYNPIDPSYGYTSAYASMRYLGTKGFGGVFEGSNISQGGAQGRYVSLLNALNNWDIPDTLDSDLFSLIMGVGGEFLSTSQGRLAAVKGYYEDGLADESPTFPEASVEFVSPTRLRREGALSWLDDRGVSVTVGDYIIILGDSNNEVQTGIYSVFAAGSDVDGDWADVAPYVQGSADTTDREVRGLYAFNTNDPGVFKPDRSGIIFFVLPRNLMTISQSGTGVLGLSVPSPNVHEEYSFDHQWEDPAAVFATVASPYFSVVGGKEEKDDILKTVIRIPGWEGGYVPLVPSTGTVIINHQTTFNGGEFDALYPQIDLMKLYHNVDMDGVVGDYRVSWSYREMEESDSAGIYGYRAPDALVFRAPAIDILRGDVLLRDGYLMTEPFANSTLWDQGGPYAETDPTYPYTWRFLSRTGVLGELSPVAGDNFSLGRPAHGSLNGVIPGDNKDYSIYSYQPGPVVETVYEWRSNNPVRNSLIEMAPISNPGLDSMHYAGYNDITFKVWPDTAGISGDTLNEAYSAGTITRMRGDLLEIAYTDTERQISYTTRHVIETAAFFSDGGVDYCTLTFAPSFPHPEHINHDEEWDPGLTIQIRIRKVGIRESVLMQLGVGAEEYNWYYLIPGSNDEVVPGGWWNDPEYRRAYEQWLQFSVNDVGRVIKVYPNDSDANEFSELAVTDVKIIEGKIAVKLEHPGWVEGDYDSHYEDWQLLAKQWDEVTARRAIIEKEVSADTILVGRDQGDDLGAMRMWHPAADFQSAFHRMMRWQEDILEGPAYSRYSKYEGIYINTGTPSTGHSAAEKEGFLSDWFKEDSYGPGTITYLFDNAPGSIWTVPYPGTFPYKQTEWYCRDGSIQRPFWSQHFRCDVDAFDSKVPYSNAWVLPLQLPQGAVIESIRVYCGLEGFVGFSSAPDFYRKFGIIGGFVKRSAAPKDDHDADQAGFGLGYTQAARYHGSVVQICGQYILAAPTGASIYLRELDPVPFFENGTLSEISPAQRLVSDCFRTYRGSHQETIDAVDYFFTFADFAFDVTCGGLINDNAKGRLELTVGTKLQDRRTLITGEALGTGELPGSPSSNCLAHRFKLYGAHVKWSHFKSQHPAGTREIAETNLTAGSIDINDQTGISHSKRSRIPLRNYPS